MWAIFSIFSFQLVSPTPATLVNVAQISSLRDIHATAPMVILAIDARTSTPACPHRVKMVASVTRLPLVAIVAAVSRATRVWTVRHCSCAYYNPASMVGSVTTRPARDSPVSVSMVIMAPVVRTWTHATPSLALRVPRVSIPHQMISGVTADQGCMENSVICSTRAHCPPALTEGCVHTLGMGSSRVPALAAIMARHAWVTMHVTASLAKMEGPAATYPRDTSVIVALVGRMGRREGLEGKTDRDRDTLKK